MSKQIHIHLHRATVKDAPLRVIKTLEKQKEYAQNGELFRIENGAYVKVKLSELPLAKPVYARAQTKDKTADAGPSAAEIMSDVSAAKEKLATVERTFKSGDFSTAEAAAKNLQRIAGGIALAIAKLRSDMSKDAAPEPLYKVGQKVKSSIGLGTVKEIGKSESGFFYRVQLDGTTDPRQGRTLYQKELRAA